MSPCAGRGYAATTTTVYATRAHVVPRTVQTPVPSGSESTLCTETLESNLLPTNYPRDLFANSFLIQQCEEIHIASRSAELGRRGGRAASAETRPRPGAPRPRTNRPVYILEH
ncbi:hypothetical protein EVAR_24886_1 [Eumeta japonica]|uniref:Uncharacterized protein n=1 Tax=Eumeta variegata TaxID=151549 RepID=A0A4C1V6Q5_EUMVA|nr:hypothetical protein EVAR_24886_1 [Eumeta japonica]